MDVSVVLSAPIGQNFALTIPLVEDVVTFIATLFIGSDTSLISTITLANKDGA